MSIGDEISWKSECMCCVASSIAITESLAQKLISLVRVLTRNDLPSWRLPRFWAVCAIDARQVSEDPDLGGN